MFTQFLGEMTHSMKAMPRVQIDHADLIQKKFKKLPEYG